MSDRDEVEQIRRRVDNVEARVHQLEINDARKEERHNMVMTTLESLKVGIAKVDLDFRAGLKDQRTALKGDLKDETAALKKFGWMVLAALIGTIASVLGSFLKGV